MFPSSLLSLLEQRRAKGSFRKLTTHFPSVDFSSNDYLGFSTQGLLTQQMSLNESDANVGSTGSRLISGNSDLFEKTENEIAYFHNTDCALLFNSGYDANLGLLSSVPLKDDLILSDELIHASLIDGIRLSYANNFKFKHNDLDALSDLIARHRANYNETYLVVESVYSMDGDCAPLKDYASICKKNNIHLIVDEAHALGVFGLNGKGLCNEVGIEDVCFARIYTYGKALGCHGAAIVGSETLKNYLINFARSFIFTTAMPQHSLCAIDAGYDLLKNTNEIGKLQKNIAYFNRLTTNDEGFISSESSVHCKLVIGNYKVQALEDECQKNNIFVKSIKSPTVKEGKERLRICLHSFNTNKEIETLVELLKN